MCPACSSFVHLVTAMVVKVEPSKDGKEAQMVLEGDAPHQGADW